MRKNLAGVAASIFAAVAVTQTPQLDDARFEALRRELSPDPTATWRTIPWRISLLAAQAEAAEQKKPLFIWAMDGHPLGCT